MALLYSASLKFEFSIQILKRCALKRCDGKRTRQKQLGHYWLMFEYLSICCSVSPQIFLCAGAIPEAADSSKWNGKT